MSKLANCGVLHTCFLIQKLPLLFWVTLEGRVVLSIWMQKVQIILIRGGLGCQPSQVPQPFCCLLIICFYLSFPLCSGRRLLLIHRECILIYSPPVCCIMYILFSLLFILWQYPLTVDGAVPFSALSHETYLANQKLVNAMQCWKVLVQVSSFVCFIWFWICISIIATGNPRQTWWIQRENGSYEWK